MRIFALELDNDIKGIERNENDKRCMAYIEAFGVPVVYVNSIGELEYMPGKMGAMMKKYGFRMNGMSRIYAPKSVPTTRMVKEQG